MRAEPQFLEVPFPGGAVLHGDLYFSVFRIWVEDVFLKRCVDSRGSTWFASMTVAYFIEWSFDLNLLHTCYWMCYSLYKSHQLISLKGFYWYLPCGVWCIQYSLHESCHLLPFVARFPFTEQKQHDLTMFKIPCHVGPLYLCLDTWAHTLVGLLCVCECKHLHTWLWPYPVCVKHYNTALPSPTSWIYPSHKLTQILLSLTISPSLQSAML